MLPRQARLRTPFSSCYPHITPGEWHHALWAREMALAQLRKGGPRWQPGGRVLSDTHFDFQGGIATGGRQETRRMLTPPVVTTDSSD
jgi:hypothetical protein